MFARFALTRLFARARLPQALLDISAGWQASCPPTLRRTSNSPITAAEAFSNPFLVRTSTRVRDFELHAKTYTKVYSIYLQDDWRIFKNFQLNLGLRTDLQQGYDTDGKPYIKLNQFWHDTQPRLGLIWDFTGNGKGKFSFNYARFIETPIPLDVNVRAGGGNSQTDKNFNVDTYGAPASANVVPGIRANCTPVAPATTCTEVGAVNLGADATPIDPGLRPQTVEEYSAGLEFAPKQNLVLGVRGFYRNYVNIIEDGSFDDGNNVLPLQSRPPRRWRNHRRQSLCRPNDWLFRTCPPLLPGHRVHGDEAIHAALSVHRFVHVFEPDW